ncbi:hypothetical protein EfmJHP80_11980 [Enterococcus faecium]|nr:hypothetical protein EfmJHP80_11980 [Enterococcus faecium]
MESSIDWLFCDQPEAYVLKRATALSVPADCFSPKEFDSKKEYEEAILHKLKEKKDRFDRISWIYANHWTGIAEKL